MCPEAGEGCSGGPVAEWQLGAPPLCPDSIEPGGHPAQRETDAAPVSVSGAEAEEFHTWRRAQAGPGQIGHQIGRALRDAGVKGSLQHRQGRQIHLAADAQHENLTYR